MTYVLIALAVILALIIAYAIGAYNKLTTLKNRIENQGAQGRYSSKGVRT